MSKSCDASLSFLFYCLLLVPVHPREVTDDNRVVVVVVITVAALVSFFLASLETTQRVETSFLDILSVTVFGIFINLGLQFH